MTLAAQDMLDNLALVARAETLAQFRNLPALPERDEWLAKTKGIARFFGVRKYGADAYASNDYFEAWRDRLIGMPEWPEASEGYRAGWRDANDFVAANPRPADEPLVFRVFTVSGPATTFRCPPNAEAVDELRKRLLFMSLAAFYGPRGLEIAAGLV